MKIYQIDAFTATVFGGNYAAVCPCETWRTDDILQKIAAENNLPETAFFIPKGNDFHLRWFTPKVEVDLCGHATLAAAHMIFNHTEYSRSEIIFHSKSGKLRVTKTADGWLAMDFPALALTAIETPDLLTKGLGKRPITAFESMDWLAVFETEADILALQPDFNALKALGGRGVIATAKGEKVDFVSRFFAPCVGIDEDPVTGSAHAQLIPYWANILQKNELDALQLSERGGTLRCEYRGERVIIAGQAVTYMVGEIFV